MQLPVLPHLQPSSTPSLHLTPLLLSPLLHHSCAAWCSFLSSHLQLSSISPLPHLSSISSAALHCGVQLPILHHLQLSSPPSNCSAALHCVMQLPVLSHLQLSSPPSLLRSALRDAASYPPPSSAALLSSISTLLRLTLMLLSSDLHCVMQLPVLLPHLQLSSPPSPLHLTPLLLSSCDLHCVMELPLLLSHLQLSSPPPHDAASSHLQLSSISPLPISLHCVMQLPLLSHLQLSSISLSTARCSFLSSSLICSSPLLHLTPLLLSSSDLHCVMQLPVLLPHLQLSSPPSLSTAWCSFFSSAALFHFSSPHLSLLRCSPLCDAASSPLQLSSSIISPLVLSPPPLSFPPPLLSSPPPLSIPPLLSSVFPPPGTGIGYPVPICSKTL